MKKNKDNFTIWLIDKINSYPWDSSFPFEKMKDMPIARGSLEAVSDRNYQQCVFDEYGLVLCMTTQCHSFFCLPNVADLIREELS